MITPEDVAATVKLVQYTSQGIGGIAHTFLAPWIARKDGEARIEAAKADAEIKRIQAKANAEIQEALLPPSGTISGKITLTDQIHLHMEYETRRRLSNVHGVVTKAAEQLEGETVPDKEPNPDFVATFFNYIQNVSDEQFHILWAKVLAGEVKSPGNTRIRTLRILRDMDQHTAKLFRIFCSLCLVSVIVRDRRWISTDFITMLTLGQNPGQNEFVDFNLFYSAILHLREYGLIGPDNTQRNCHMSILTPGKELRPLWYQDRFWALKPMSTWNPDEKFMLGGIEPSIAGWQLAHVVDSKPVPKYVEAMKEFFRTKQLEMIPWSLEED